MSATSTVSLSCPKCGARLEITARVSVFACSYCLSNVMVERAGGIVSLALVDAVSLVQKGTDKTAAELAINRIKVDLYRAKEELQDYGNRTQKLLNDIDRQRREQARNYMNGALVISSASGILGGSIINALFHNSDVNVVIGLLCAILTFILLKKYINRVDKFLANKRTQVWNDRWPGLKRVESAVETIEAQLEKNLQIANS